MERRVTKELGIWMLRGATVGLVAGFIYIVVIELPGRRGTPAAARAPA